MDVRASDSERDATVERLRDAAAEGRLTLEELTDRIEAASSAVMRSELVPLTTDLPVSVGRSHSEPADVRKVGDIKRKGAWVVPAECRFRSYFGAVIVDLREATITAQELRIDARTPFGNIVLLVPDPGQPAPPGCSCTRSRLRRGSAGASRPTSSAMRTLSSCCMRASRCR